MSDIVIRKAADSEAEKISAILIRCGIDWSPEMVRHSFTAKDMVWVMQENNQIIAVLIVREIVSDLWEVLQIAVDPTCHRQGYGKKLLSHLVLKAQKNSVEKIQLEVRRSNQAAIALYENIGFKVVGVRSAYYQDGEDAMLMDLFV